MPNEKYEKLWELMNTYNFDLVHDNYKEFKCILCKRIARNATQSKCGCRYCHECIENHLGLYTQCPGNSKSCNSWTITPQIDHAANLQISHFEFCCPIEFCTVKRELCQMEDHIKSHELCPFVKVGCTLTVPPDQIADHMQSESQSHMNLVTGTVAKIQSQMTGWLQHSDTQVSLLTRSIEELVVENRRLKEKNDSLTAEMRSIDNQLQEYSTQFEERVKSTVKSFLAELFDRLFKVESRKLNMEMKQTELSNAFSLFHNELKDSIRKLERDHENLEQELVVTKNETIHLKTLFKLNNVSLGSVETPGEISSKDRKIIRGKRPFQEEMTLKVLQSTKPEVCSNRSSSVRTSISSQVSPVSSLELLRIKIPNFTEMYSIAKDGVETKILGEPFYTRDRYRFCLCVYPNGVDDATNEYLSVSIQSMRGDYDDQLTWPMEHTIVFSLVDQTVNEPSVFGKPSVEIKFLFNRPTTEMGMVIGPRRFIKLKSLFSNSSLFMEDSIMVALSLGKS